MKLDPLGLAYLAASEARNMLYDTGLFSARLRGRVVSIGSLSAGGAGKTPVVLWLGEQLMRRSVRFDILSRGYRRKISGVHLVDATGTALEYGDEPLLMAKRLGMPVIVGENRYHAGVLAEQKFGPQLHLLDDGFQHRGLARDLDIVLVTALDLDDRMLPLGRLREPPASLERADVLILMDEVSGEHVQTLESLGKPIWRARRGLVLPAGAPRRPLAFCGIARPQNFFDDLRKAGAAPAAESAFPDHHRYREADLRELERLRSERGCDGFIITEKDLMNLRGLAAGLNPLAVAQIKISVENAPSLVSRVIGS
jgi:tetraacyldisaccharide 4'-kinase